MLASTEMGFMANQKNGSDANTDILTLQPAFATPQSSTKELTNAKESGANSPDLWKRTSPSFPDGTKPSRWMEKLPASIVRKRSKSSDTISVDQFQAAEDEIVALYMQASASGSIPDLTLADLANNKRSKEPHSRSSSTKAANSVLVTKGQESPKSVRTLASFLTLKHQLEAEDGEILPVSAHRPKKAVQKAIQWGSPTSSYSFVVEHKNNCCSCTSYVFIFKTRCLVCGKLYCRFCMKTGMGEMKEGRKCMECVGICFNKRYINRVGKGIFLAKMIKQAELKAFHLQNYILSSKIRPEESTQ